MLAHHQHVGIRGGRMGHERTHVGQLDAGSRHHQVHQQNTGENRAEPMPTHHDVNPLSAWETGDHSSSPPTWPFTKPCRVIRMMPGPRPCGYEC